MGDGSSGDGDDAARRLLPPVSGASPQRNTTSESRRPASGRERPLTTGLIAELPSVLQRATFDDDEPIDLADAACTAALPAMYTRFYCSKWVTFSCATAVMLSAGLPYAFSIYGPSLRVALDLPAAVVSRMGAFSNAGGYSALFAGLFYD